MRIEISVVPGSAQLVVRAALVNDSFEPVAVSRNAFVGPSLTALGANGMPQPPSVEPTYGQADEPLTLQPFSLYGRDRFFDELEPGEHEFSAEYTPADGPSERLRVTATINVSEPGGG